MLEDKLAELLQAYLGKYIAGVSKESLRISVWNGDIELKNAEIKRDVLVELGLPLTIAAGYVGSVKIQIPWSRLGRVPILVLVDEVILCLRPVHRQDVAGAKQMACQAIMQSVESKERKYLEAQSRSAGGSDRETWIGALANTIVRSLKFNITNVHVRYEDEQQLGRAPACSAGITLSKLAAVTVGDGDSASPSKKEKSNVSAQVSKLVEMQQLALYFIPQSPLTLVEEGDMDVAPVSSKGPNMPSSRQYKESRGGVLKQRSRAVQELLSEKDFYLVKPVSAWARYRRHEPGEVHLAAYQDIQITVDRVSFRLAQEQYQSMLMFAESAKQWNTLLQHVALRPEEPVTGNAVLWWRYAVQAVLVRLGRLKSGASWHELMKRARLRRQYVASYAVHLRAPEKRPHEDEDLAVIQQGVSADVIAEWRVLGRQLLESTSMDKAKAWQQEGPALSLSKEDWERCNELIGYREGMENPFRPDLDSSTAHTVVGLAMGSCGLGLARGGEELLGLSCKKTVARLALFSHKTEVSAGLASCVVHASGKPVLETGVETVEEAATISFVNSSSPGEANPWSLVAALQPAYVLVEKEDIDMLVGFFESTNQLAPTATQEAATVFQRTLEDVGRAARAGLGDSVALHGRFKLDLDFDAPKICIPSASRRRSGRSHLLLDMGRLKLCTEAGLEALTTTLSDVSVRVEKAGAAPGAAPNLKGFFLATEARASSEGTQRSFTAAPPVIEECSVVVQLAEKKTAHEKGAGGPSFEAQITIPSLAFNYSPAINRELLTILSPFLAPATPSPAPAEPASSRGVGSWASRASASSVSVSRGTPRPSTRLDSSAPPQGRSTRSSGRVKLAVVGDLGRLIIRLSAHAPGPPPSLGGEQPLLFLKAKGTQLQLALLHSGDIHASASMRSLVVEDALASRGAQGRQYLIQSTAILAPPAPSEGALPRASSTFYDAEEDLPPSSEGSGASPLVEPLDRAFRSGESPHLEPSESVFHDAPSTLGTGAALPSPDRLSTLGAGAGLPSPGPLGGGHEQQVPGERFFHAELVLWSQDSRGPGRPAVQVQLKSGGLTFHFNRPTIMSLIACVSELTSVPRRASTLGTAPTTPGRQQSGVPAWEEARAQGEMEEGHVTFALLLNMEETQLLLNVEDSPCPLALCLQEQLTVSVKVQGGGGLEVEADIGNFKVLDPGLGRAHPHGWILTPACRSHSAPQGSFVSLRYASSGSGMLEGGYPSSVHVTVGEVRVVFFQRFVMEVVSYFTGLVPPREQGPEQEVPQTDREAETLAAIKLGGTMADSQIVLPESSTSSKALVFAMEKLAFRNQLEDSGPDEDTPGTLVDNILITVESLHLHSVVGDAGGEGADMIHEVHGLDLQVRRPLKDPDCLLPRVAWVAVKIADLTAGMSGQDFECLQQCALGNFSEQPRQFSQVFAEGAFVAVARTPSSGRTGSWGEAPSATMQFNVEAANLCLSLFPGQHHDNSFASLQVEGFWLQHTMLSDGGARLLVSTQTGSLRDCSQALEEALPVLWMAGGRGEVGGKSPSVGASAQSRLLQQLRNVFLPEAQPAVQSFISAEYASAPGDQSLAVTLQLPCVLLDLPFFKKLVDFFAPQQSGSAHVPANPGLAGWRKAVRLQSPLVCQDLGSLTLTPLRPMVADAPGIDEFVYEGKGRALLLTPSACGHAPLVYVGPGKRLRLRNIVVHGSPARLQAVVHLAPNSAFTACPQDGVVFLDPDQPGRSQSGAFSETRQHQRPAPAARLGGTFRLAIQASAVELLAVDEPEWAQEVVVRPETALRLQLSGSVCMNTSQGLTEIPLQVASLRVTTGGGLPVLEPVDASALIAIDGVRTKARVSLSHVAGNLPLSTLSLLLRLQQQALAVLGMPDEKALAQCDLFNRILVYPDGKQKLSFWRPRAPPGFSPLGDCLTSDGLPPSRAVLAVNMQSSLASRPAALRLLFRIAAEGCKEGCFSVWEPVPREGFAALGCIIQEGARQPALSTAFCLSKAVLCTTWPRDCITAQGKVNGSEMKDGLAFWRMANRASTVVACEGARGPPLAQALEVLDKLEAFAGEPSPDPGAQLGRDSCQDAAEPRPQGEALLLSPTRQHVFLEADTFDCVWASSAVADHPASIWRPRCGTGTAILGDVAMEGLEPPASAYVVHGSGDGLLAKPERWHPWNTPGWPARQAGVSFWYPLGPPGYCGLGVVAQRGLQEPPLDLVRCVRNDALVACDYHPAAVALPGADREDAESLAAHRVDNKARTFFPAAQSPPRRLAQGIFQLDEPNAQYSFQLSLEVPAVSATVYDDFGGLMAPVADLRFADVRLDCLQSPEALKTQVAFALNVKTHHPLSSQWEPFLERWNGMVTYHTRETAPGTLTDLRLASNTPLNVDIAPVGLNQLLECYASWQRLCTAQEMAQRRFHLSEAESQARLNGSASARQQGSVMVVNKAGLDLVVRFPEEPGSGEEPSVLLIPPASLTSLHLPPSAGLSKLRPRPTSGGHSLELLALTVLKTTLPLSSRVLGKSCYCTVTPRDEAGGAIYYAHTKAARLRRAKPSHLECCWNECFVFPSSPGANLEINLMDAQTGRALARLSWLAPPLEDQSGGSLNGGMKGSWYIMHLTEGGSTAHLLLEWAWLGASGQAPGQRSTRLGSASRRSDLEISCTEQGPFISVISGYATGAVPWKLPGATLAREISFQDGVKQIVVRSLVVVHNGCPLPVEVALCPAALLGQGDAGLECADQSEYLHGTKSTDLAGQGVMVGAVEVEELFENQRCVPLAGWSSAYLLPSDPKAWSNRSNTVSSRVFHEPQLPRGWVWASDWHLEVNAAVDKDGWAYYPSLWGHSWPPSRPEQRSKGVLDWVRQRRHVRYRHFLPENVLEERVSLGVVGPGDSVPVPARFLTQTFDDLVVQVRPAPPGGTTFRWGDPEAAAPAPGGLHMERDSGEEWARLNTFRVRALRETEVTVRCAAAAGPGAAWILMSAEASSLRSGGPERESFQDWRVLLKPPLVVRNALPLPVDLVLGGPAEGAGPAHGSGSGGFSRSLEAGAHWDVMAVCPVAPVPMSLSVGAVWELDTLQKGQLVQLSSKESFPDSLVLTHKHSQRRVEIQVTCLSNPEQEAVRVLIFSVPTYLDVRGCPPLALSFDSAPEKDKHGLLGLSKLKDLKLPGQPRVAPETRSGAICGEEPPMGPWLLPSLEPHSTLRIALRDADPQGLLSWVALREGGNQQVTAVGADGRFIELVAFLEVDSQGSAEAPSRVIRLRPLYGLTNRVGRPVLIRFLRTIGVPPVHELEAHAYQASLLLPAGSRPNIVQAAVDGCEWSVPVVLQREGRSHILLRRTGGGDPTFVALDVRPGGGNCGFSVILQPGWQGLPFLLENRSLVSAVHFRQVHGQLWQQLPPMSCKAYAWEDPTGEQGLQLTAGTPAKARESRGSSSLHGPALAYQAYTFTAESHPPLRASEGQGRTKDLQVSITDRGPQCQHLLVQDTPDTAGDGLPFELGVSTQARDEVPGGCGVKGESEGERVRPTSSLRGSRQQELRVAVDLLSVGFSIIDARPQELLYVFVEDFVVDYIHSSGTKDNSARIGVKKIQVDNQLPLSPLPVLFALEKLPESSPHSMLLQLEWKEKGSAGGDEVYQYACVKMCEETWVVNIHEAVIWRLWDFCGSIHMDRLSTSAQEAAFQADPYVQIGKYETTGVLLKLTLEPAPSTRPRGILGSWGALVTAAGNAKRMPIRFRSYTIASQRLRKSAIPNALAMHVVHVLRSQVLQILSGVDVLGVVSSIFATLGQGTSSLSILKHTGTRRLHFQEALGDRPGGIGEGLLYGAETVAQGVARGARGVFERSKSGLDQAGPVGLVTGLGRGVAGLFLHPLAGMLSCVALCVDGLDASLTSWSALVVPRHPLHPVRYPRAIQGDCTLREYHEPSAIGQLVLYKAEMGSYFGKRDIFRDHAKFVFSDLYQEHFQMRRGRMLLLTSRRVMMVQTNMGAGNEDRAAVLGSEPGVVRWEVPWENLLSAEVGNYPARDQSPAVVVHVRYSAGRLFHRARCPPPAEPHRILQAILETAHKFGAAQAAARDAEAGAGFQNLRARSSRRRLGLSPSATSAQLVSLGEQGLAVARQPGPSLASSRSSIFSLRSFRRRGEAASGSGLELEPVETTVFVRVLAALKGSAACRPQAAAKQLSIWRPLPPEGCVFLGDVLCLQEEPPACGTVYMDKGPDCFAAPTGFKLVWRSEERSSGQAVSVWEPIPPEGFVAVGHVALPDFCSPAADPSLPLRCPRRDLVEAALVTPEPVWHLAASRGFPWACFVHAVGNRLWSFLAYRSREEAARAAGWKVCTQET